MMSLAMAAAMVAAPPIESQLTIYNGGFALVKEQRVLDLKTGEQEWVIEDVAQMIEANSVAVRSLSHPGSFEVLEQNYQYDLISPVAILEKAVNQRIGFNRILPDGSTEKITGVLLSAPYAIVSDQNGRQNQTYNGMVVRTDDGRILLNPSGEIEVYSMPGGLISKPSLLWVLNSQRAGANTIEFSYLTQGLSWKCDYVLSLNQAGTMGNLKAWVTVTNNSGTTYENAKLAFLAGEVNRAPAGFGLARGGGAPNAAMADQSAKMAEQAFGEYHLYKLGRPATIANKQIKQVSLMQVEDIPVGTEMVFDLGPYYGNVRNRNTVGTGPQKPTVYTTFMNDEESNLGMALPKGTFKVYQTDQEEELQMQGEDYIDHTPRNEKVRIETGKAFDVVVEARTVDFRWLNGDSDDGSVITIEFEVRNRKKTPAYVRILDRKYGDFTVQSPDMPKKADANTLEWALNLKPDEVRKITYTVTTRF